MQIVIDISKKLYDRYKEKDHIKRCDLDEFEKAFDRCVILPKGHGRLIDASQLLTVTDYMEDGTERCYVPYVHIKEATTIIEADSPKRRKGTSREDYEPLYNCENWIP